MDGSHLWVIRKTSMPAVLLELGFMDSNQDYKHLLEDSYRRECATEICKGICEAFNVKYVPEKEEVPAKTNVKAPEKAKTVYRVRKSKDDAKTQLGAFENLNSAKTLSKRTPGYKVFDDKGKLVYTPPVPETIYTVKKGDVLSKIADKYNTTTKKLQDANNIKNANKIYPGQKIKIK